MKTLGQVAFEEWKATMVGKDADYLQWENVAQSVWEEIAQAVRAAVIEECAKICDEDAKNPDQFRDAATECARAIRSLK